MTRHETIGSPRAERRPRADTHHGVTRQDDYAWLRAENWQQVMQDPSLHDEQLENEIRLVGELVLAASQSEDHLSQEQIDEILGIPGGAPADVG